MKIPDTYKNFIFDNKTTAVSIDKELRYLWEEILKTDIEIINLFKKSHYQLELFNRICKDKLVGFNNLCCSSVLFKAFYDGVFKKENRKTKKFKQIITQFVANYFPSWMWKDIEFVCALEFNYGEKVLFRFEWENNDKKYEVSIAIPNPDNIVNGASFSVERISNQAKNIMNHVNDGNHMTSVSVSIRNSEHYTESKFIGSAYMNSDIQNIIDSWAKDIENGISDRESVE